MKKTISSVLTAITAFAVVIAASCTEEPEPTPDPTPTPTPTPSTVAVTGVRLDKTTISLVEGASETLTATVDPNNATNKAISWKSSDTGVATVDGNGKVTAVKAGSSTITVTTTDGSKTASCAVTVTAKTVSVTGVKLDKTELELVEGEDAQLAATVSPDDASDKSVSWKSSEAGVATVDDSGKVTAVKAGSTTVTVTTTDGSKTATCTVTVTAKIIPVEEVKIEPATLEITEGETAQLKASVSPADADQEVDWTSTDSQILTVDQNGLVTALKPGNASVVIRSKTYNDKQGSCKVTVKQDKTLKGITLNPSEITLKAGESRDIAVIYTPEYAAEKTVTWASSDPSVATVNEGKVSALKEGTAKITATSKDGSHKAECTVTVSKAERPFLYMYVDDDLLVNGVPDPLDGTFNDGVKQYVSPRFVDTDGKDLYSLEIYYTAGQYHTWVCKNRQPLKDVNKYADFDSSLRGFSARNGVYAIAVQDHGTKDVKVVRYQESDGDLVEYTIESAGTEFYVPEIAVAPNGDIHVAVNIKDSFRNRYIAWFKVDKGGTLTSKLIDNDGDPSLDVSSSGDVYIWTRKDSGSYQEGQLYKNGSLSKTYEKVDYNFSGRIKCVGNSVYTIVNDFTKKEARIHKDGKTVRTVKFDKETNLNGQFWVTSGGDVYFTTTTWYDHDDYRLYKNGNILYTFKKDIWDICVIE